MIKTLGHKNSLTYKTFHLNLTFIMESVFKLLTTATLPLKLTSFDVKLFFGKVKHGGVAVIRLTFIKYWSI